MIQFILLNPFTFFTHPSNPLTSGNHPFVLYIYELFLFCLFTYFGFHIPHISEIIWHFSFSV